METGKLMGIWARQEWGGKTRSFESATVETGKGLAEDISFGSRRRITIIEEEVWKSVMKELGSNMLPETRRANLMISGVRLAQTKRRILRIGEALVQIKGETKPCESMNTKLPGLKNALNPNWNGGAYGSVLQGSTISLGDKVEWEQVWRSTQEMD